MSEQWVPVEHRFLGLDRRTFRPALNAAIPRHLARELALAGGHETQRVAYARTEVLRLRHT